VLAEHEPPLQVYVVTVRDCVPLFPQVPLNPPQAPQEPTCVVPQEVPFVFRVQPCVCVVVLAEHEPPLQVYVVTVRDCVPLFPHVPLNPPQAPHEPNCVVPQEVPFVFRVQDCVCVVVLAEHEPPLQVYVVTVRDCVPLFPHVPLNPPQAPHEPNWVVPQEVPFVFRVQDCVCVVVLAEHEPPLQVYVVTVRDCVPLLPHVPLKPPQAPHEPYCVVPHDVPFVFRVHPCVCVVVLAEHEPPLQVYVVTVRDCVPLFPHVPLNPPQAPHEPYCVVPQEVPFVFRVHASVSVVVVATHEPLLHAYVETLRVRVPALPHVPLNPPQALQAP